MGYCQFAYIQDRGYHINLGDNKRAVWAFEVTLTGIVKFNYFIQSFVLRNPSYSFICIFLRSGMVFWVWIVDAVPALFVSFMVCTTKKH
jgi:hypothetical protein